MREKAAEKWKQFTHSVLSRLPRLSRPWRVVRNLVCIALAVYLAWLFAGGGALTARWAFRRAERLALVGPSEILLEQRDGDKVTVTGRTESGYFIGSCAKYGNFLGGWYARDLLYVERREKVTFSVARPDRGVFDVDGLDLLLFCDDPAVSRGEADVTLAGGGSLNGRRYDFSKTYTVEFFPEVDGVLSGRIEAETEDDDSWNSLLERVMLGDLYSMSCPVTIRLYDGSGRLLVQTSYDYRCPRW